MNPIASLMIDGLSCHPANFAVPEMSLSSSRATMVPHAFEVSLRAASLLERLDAAYRAWVEDSRKDDAQCGGPQDELALAGYPDLEQVLRQPQLAELLVGHYLLQESLGQCTWDGHSPIHFWLDQITGCCVGEGVVQLHGICYRRGVAPR